MPIYPDVRPNWLKPEQASVLESSAVKALRALAPWFGGDDPASAMGVGAMLPLSSPLRSAAARAEQLASTAKDVRSSLPAASKAFEALQQRYPRLMSHITAVSPVDVLKEGSSGGIMVPHGTNPNLPISRLYLSEATDPAEMATSIRHELGHVTQNMRMGEAARREGTDNPFSKVYNELEQRYGYHDNPLEVEARRIGEQGRPGTTQTQADIRSRTKNWTYNHPAVSNDLFNEVVRRRSLQGLAEAGAVPAEFAPVGGETAWNAAQGTVRNPQFVKGMPKVGR